MFTAGVLLQSSTHLHRWKFPWESQLREKKQALRHGAVVLNANLLQRRHLLVLHLRNVKHKLAGVILRRGELLPVNTNQTGGRA